MIAKCKPLPCSISRIDWNIYILLFDKPFLFSFLYCIHPFSSGKTSIQFDPAPTVTFAHHLLSLSLSQLKYCQLGRPAAFTSLCTMKETQQSPEVEMVQGHLLGKVTGSQGGKYIFLIWLTKYSSAAHRGQDWVGEKIWFHTCAMCKMQVL